MINNIDTKVGRYWDYPSFKVNDNTQQEIKNVYEYQMKLLQKAKEENIDNEDYNAFSSVIKQIKLLDFNKFLSIHQSILKMSMKDALSEIINLLNKGVMLPNPKRNNIYAMIAELSVEIQRRVLQFSSCAVSQNNINITNNLENKPQQYQEILNALQNSNSDYYQFIVNSFKEWINQTFQNTSLKEVILTMQDFIIENNIRQIKQKINIESKKLVTSQNELMKYKADKRKINRS